MPLAKLEVVQAKKILKKITSSTNELLDIKSIKKIMDADENFMSFVYDTSIGMKIYEEVNELISLVIKEMYYDLDSLNNHTYNFLNMQEQICKKMVKPTSVYKCDDKFSLK